MTERKRPCERERLRDRVGDRESDSLTMEEFVGVEGREEEAMVGETWKNIPCVVAATRDRRGM